MTSGMRWIGLLLASAVAAAGCSAEPQATSSPRPAAAETLSPSPAVPCACGGGDMFVERGPYVIAGMPVPGFFPDMGPTGWQADDVALRDVVVVGTVIAKEAGFFAEPAHVYKPFAVKVDQVIRGDARAGRMGVAVEGGTVGCYTVHVDVSPALEPGRRYVFFLTDVVGAEPAPRNVWEAWPIDAPDVVATVQGPMPLAQLVERIARLAAGPNSATP